MSRVPLGVWLKNRSASPVRGLVAMPCWAHVEYEGFPTFCGGGGHPSRQRSAGEGRVNT